MCGLIIEAIGWQYVFYVTGALSLVFSLSWILFVYDSPAKHPRIDTAEKEYIEGDLVGLSDSAKVHTTIHDKCGEYLFDLFAVGSAISEYTNLASILGIANLAVWKHVGPVFYIDRSAKVYE